MRLELIDDEAGAAIGGVHHDFQRLECLQIHVRQKMSHIGSHGVYAMPDARTTRGWKFRALGKALDLLQTIVAADGFGLLADELHAVVVSGVVAGGYHDTAVITAVEG